MKALRVVGLWVALVLGMASSAMAEGFALTEWSARGLGLASGMVGRADDVSAIAYNAAGITQLPGVQVMGGMGLIAPMGTLSLDTTHGKQETTTKPAVLGRAARVRQLAAQRQPVAGAGRVLALWSGQQL